MKGKISDRLRAKLNACASPSSPVEPTTKLDEKTERLIADVIESHLDHLGPMRGAMPACVCCGNRVSDLRSRIAQLVSEARNEGEAAMSRQAAEMLVNLALEE